MELFPNSDSSIWSAFKNAQEERENNINNNSNQNNIEKENTGFKINTQEGNTSEESSVNKETKNPKPNGNELNKTIEKANNGNTSDEPEIKDNNDTLNLTKDDKITTSRTITDQTDNLASNKGYYFIQLASLSDPRLVEEEWKRLIKVYKELSNKKYSYKEINLKNGKTFYRLIVGEFEDKASARNFCKITLKKNMCIIRYYE